jgi:predicted HTH transcriptional regulator
MISYREQQIIDFIKKFGKSSSKEIFDKAKIGVSYATLKRILSKLISDNYLATKGNGKGTRYLVSPLFEVIQLKTLSVILPNGGFD